MSMQMQADAIGWAVWITGLPGSGKSALTDALAIALRNDGHPVHLLRMDERRKVYFPDPKYDDEERETAYSLFAEEAAALVKHGFGVLMDGTAHKVVWRRQARERILHFAEIHLRCALSTAMRREEERPEGLVMAGLYEKALERKKTGVAVRGLGAVVGVDVPFEADPQAELIIVNDTLDLVECVQAAMDYLRPWIASQSQV